MLHLLATVNINFLDFLPPCNASLEAAACIQEGRNLSVRGLYICMQQACTCRPYVPPHGSYSYKSRRAGSPNLHQNYIIQDINHQFTNHETSSTFCRVNVLCGRFQPGSLYVCSFIKNMYAALQQQQQQKLTMWLYTIMSDMLILSSCFYLDCYKGQCPGGSYTSEYSYQWCCGVVSGSYFKSTASGPCYPCSTYWQQIVQV